MASCNRDNKEEQVLKPGVVILQINGNTVTADMPLSALYTYLENALPTTIAVRDLDSFMHLIRIRDKEEVLRDVVTYTYG